MKKFYKLFLIFFLPALFGCSKYQPVKDVWKSTKGLWNTYVSQPASVDYENKADLPDESLALSRDMQGIDVELAKLERTMQNADRPPTQEWLDQLFNQFPWLNGFAGIKYDGTILGQQPPDSMKDLDFNPLLYEDKKQSSRALRTDIQPSPLGPEIMLATPIYDGVDFLGIVVAYFDMRSIMSFSKNPQDIVILAPNALLWPGKYDFAATPLAGVDWSKVAHESTAGTCTNSNGTFIYVIRYLGNLPLVFAIPEKGNFPEGNGGIEQGYAYFPKEREKMPPPDLPERKSKEQSQDITFAQSTEETPQDQVQPELQEEPGPEVRTAQDSRPSPNEIQPGSRESVLLKGGQSRSARHVEERQLEGENVEVQRVQRPRTPQRQTPIIIPDEPEEAAPPISPMRRPSPFGPPQEEEQPAQEERTFTRPSPFGPPPTEPESAPAQPSTAPAETSPSPAADTPPITLEEPLGGEDAENSD